MELKSIGWAQQKIIREMTQREQRSVLWEGWPTKVPYEVRRVRARFLWDLHDTGPWRNPNLTEVADRYGMSRPVLSNLLRDFSGRAYGSTPYPKWIVWETKPEGRKTLSIALRPGLELPPDPREPKTTVADRIMARSTEKAPQEPVEPVEAAPVTLNGSGPVEEVLTASDRAILIMRLAGEIFRDVDAVGPALGDDETEGLRAEVELWRQRTEELESALTMQRRKTQEAEETAAAHKRALEALQRTNGRLDENLRAILSGQKAPDNRDARMFRQLMEGR